ncbi:Two component transcriptional regulatory protein DevR [Amycolatopsis camponoti]|uniref:Two component transcriptional regulatory protein DevR n=1 Tax=Amycolatopsis camponoti TaxID=2606593 RepID=A0A6I8LX57_9PSEU|nr:response regulator transcription factor [Amycolatopsis camponoti]VVJ21828.1 Two component transcriptional regulatory protein DevR [Amycolatopsis camponoti]
MDDRTQHDLPVITVFLVDDHELVRRGVAELVDDEPDLTVVGQASSVAEAMARIPALRPDVAVLDVRLPDGNGVELCRDLRAALPGLRCLMLTSFTDEDSMVEAVLAGAEGYVIKDVKGLQLVDAIRRVGSGETLLDARAVAALVGELRAKTGKPGPLAGLSEQELVLLDLLGESLTNRQIAERMFLAEKTVKNYVSRLLAKLGLERRSQAAVLVTGIHDAERRPGG